MTEFVSILKDLFGPGTWGTGGNMVAWVICGCIGFGWLHSKEKARHILKMNQAKAHHDEQIALLKAQHETQMNALKGGSSDG
jgi:hypothetical protein